MPSTSRSLRRLEVTHGGLGARPVTTVDVEVVAEGDEGDLQLRDTIAGRSGRMLRVGAGSGPHSAGLNAIAV